MSNQETIISLANPKRAAIFGVAVAIFTALIVYKLDVVATLAAVLAIGVLALIFANTEVATLLVIFVLYTNMAVVLAKYHNVPTAIAGSVFLVLAIPLTNYLLMRRQPVLINRIFWLMLAQLVAMSISAFFSEYSWQAMGRIVVYLAEGVVLYFLILNTVRNQEMLRKAVWTLVVAGTLMGSLSILQNFVGSHKNFGGFAQTKNSKIGTGATGWNGKGELRDARASGTVGEENYYAQIMLMLLPLAASRFFYEKSRKLRVFGALACIPIAGAIMLTFSRGAFVSAVATVLAMVYLGSIKIRHLLALGLAFVVIVPIAMPDYAFRIFTLFRAVGVQQEDKKGSSKTLDASMRGRATENLAALKIFLDHPVIGVGPGQTNMFTTKYGSEGGLSRLEGTRQAHNMYLGVLSDTGLLGFFCFMSIFLVTITSLLKIRRKYSAINPELTGLAIGLTLSIVAFMSSAVFLSSAYERFYWLIMALAGVTIHIIQREEESTPELSLV
jgi:putative inorganic carbon (HCO3(-)) transporter